MSEFMGFEDAITQAKAPPSESGGGLLVLFYTKPVRDQAASEEREIPIYKQQTYVKILSPGNDKEVVDRPVRENDTVRDRFPVEWARFMNKQNEDTIEGTDLKIWALIDPALALTYAENGIKSVEQLSKTPDVNLQTLPRGVELKYRAEAWLKGQSEELGKLKKDVDTLKSLILKLDTSAHAATLKKQIREAQEALGGGEEDAVLQRHDNGHSGEGSGQE
jgi:hypothetical protein